jgi:Kef-type K+ transport system membrane component KefB
MSYGFFIPIFFVMTGTHLEFANFFENLIRAVLFLGVITTIQVGSGFLASKINGYTNREGLLVGFGMLPYGEVTLVVMTALLNLVDRNPSFFTGEDVTGLFSTSLILIMLTVVLTPMFMKLVNRYMKHV